MHHSKNTHEIHQLYCTQSQALIKLHVRSELQKDRDAERQQTMGRVM